MPEVLYKIHFPDGDEPGEFFEQGTFTEEGAVAYLSQWFGSPLDRNVLQFFCTEIAEKTPATSTGETST